MKLKDFFRAALLKSIVFNFRSLPCKDALKLPIILFGNTRINSLKGRIEITPPLSPGMIRIGRCEVCGMEKFPTTLQVDGVLRFQGKASIGSGSVVQVGRQGKLTLGDCFRITGRSSIFCQNNISFGENVLVSWDVLFMDSDHHDIFDRGGTLLNPTGEIVVGDHVWFGCRCTVLKGCSVADGCVVASGSVLTRAFQESGTVIGGEPARKVLHSGIEWRS